MRYSSVNMHFDKLVKVGKSEVKDLWFMWADLFVNIPQVFVSVQ